MFQGFFQQKWASGNGYVDNIQGWANYIKQGGRCGRDSRPTQQPEVIPISSDKENDDDENSSDTSTVIDTEAEGGKNIAEEEERHQNWFGGIGRGNGAFNALVPPVLLQLPAHLRMSAEDYELLFLG